MHRQLLWGMREGRQSFLPLQIDGVFTLLLLELLYCCRRFAVSYVYDYSYKLFYNMLSYSLWLPAWYVEVCCVGSLPLGISRLGVETCGPWLFINHLLIND